MPCNRRRRRRAHARFPALPRAQTAGSPAHAASRAAVGQPQRAQAVDPFASTSVTHQPREQATYQAPPAAAAPAASPSSAFPSDNPFDASNL